MKHLKENNEIYFRHMKFALSIGILSIISGVAFITHGLFPFIPMPITLNINAMKGRFETWHNYTEARKNK